MSAGNGRLRKLIDARLREAAYARGHADGVRSNETRGREARERDALECIATDDQLHGDDCRIIAAQALGLEPLPMQGPDGDLRDRLRAIVEGAEVIGTGPGVSVCFHGDAWQRLARLAGAEIGCACIGTPDQEDCPHA